MSVELANKNGQSLTNHTFAIFNKARDAGIQISPSRTIDVFKSLSSIDLSDRTQFQIALRVNLVSSKEHEVIFDRVFYNYWNNIPESDGDYILANSEMIRGDLEVGLSNEGQNFLETGFNDNGYVEAYSKGASEDFIYDIQDEWSLNFFKD